MITQLSDLILELRNRESLILKDQGLNHGPTIGAMYEGLTKSLLYKSIPLAVGLRVVGGFATDDTGHLSRQIDCMLVRGEGTSIPYTDVYKWHIKDIVAVFEVKKRMYGKELSETQGVFSSINDIYISTVPHMQKINKSIAHNFFMLTGYAFGHSSGPEHLFDTATYQSLQMDHGAPLRIAFSYEGYKTEEALKEGFKEHLRNDLITKPIMPDALPNMIVCGDNSIIRLNTQPFLVPKDDDWWMLYASCSCNPMNPLLWIIWYRLVYILQKEMKRETSLQNIILDPFFAIRFFVHPDGHLGTEYRSVRATSKSGSLEWTPLVMKPGEWALLRISQEGVFQLSDWRLLQWQLATGVDISSTLSKLVDMRLVARRGASFACCHERLFSGFGNGRIFTVLAHDKGRLDNFLINLPDEPPSEDAKRASDMLAAWHSAKRIIR